jgi:hypothetical protein
MARKRSIRDQVISGFRIGGLMVLSFAFFGAMVQSARWIVGTFDETPTISQRSLGPVAMLFLTGILFVTVRRWTEWLIGILAYCLLRFSGGLLLGPYLKRPVSRFEVAAWMLYLLVAILLTTRHVQRRPKGAEKIGLVSFVLCLPFALILNASKPLFFGLLLLALGELVEALRRSNRRYGRHRGNDETIVPM